MYTCACIPIVRVLLVVAIVGSDISTATDEANYKQLQKRSRADDSSKILEDLYITLRQILFPKSPLSKGKVSNRFVLMSPGKVLNYFDYFPGQEYEESLLRKNNSAPETLVPPLVMEKWFDIADVMVGGDPFNGGTTGKSLANVYHTIISQMEVLDVKETSEAAQARYNEAYNFLTAPVPDPRNLANNMTRLSLYSYYQDQYSQRRLEMEDKIDEARHTRGSIEYELWFQRHYPALNNRVEAAYTEWLVFGQKDQVEVYKAYIDTSSAGTEIEDAKMALRASGVQSLDRTRTIYPVSFEPSNWYKYLLPKIKGPSRDMLLAQKSMLESESDTLKAMIKFNKGSQLQQNPLNKLKQRVHAAKSSQLNKTTAAMQAGTNCLGKKSAQNYTETNSTAAMSGPCEKLRMAVEGAVGATLQRAQTQAEYFSTSFFLGSSQKYNSFLNIRVEAIARQLLLIDKQLNKTDSNNYLGDIADSKEFRDLNKLLNVTEQNLDDEWEQFEYDSDSSHISETSNTISIHASGSAGFVIPAEVVGLPGYITLSESLDFGLNIGTIKQAINSAKIKVSGELLRVTIKRPWFKPSIFEEPKLSFMQQNEDKQKTLVSPGLLLTEEQFRDAVNDVGDNGKHYLLPEYVTSFVLAREIKLQFSGVDSSTVTHIMQLTAGASFSVGYNMFSVKPSFGIGLKKQTVTIDRTANGMIISIPGAQIIGYYTQVLPQFPIL